MTVRGCWFGCREQSRWPGVTRRRIRNRTWRYYLRQAKNSFLARKNQPAAVMRRRKPAASTSAAFVSSWMTRPVSAVNPKARASLVPFSSILLMILLAGGAIGISSIVSGRDRLKDAKAHNVKVKQEVESLTDEIH